MSAARGGAGEHEHGGRWPVIITCQRCGVHAVAAEDHDAAVVPARWRRVAVLVAGPGRRITGDLSGYQVAGGYWLCPAHLLR